MYLCHTAFSLGSCLQTKALLVLCLAGHCLGSISFPGFVDVFSIGIGLFQASAFHASFMAGMTYTEQFTIARLKTFCKTSSAPVPPVRSMLEGTSYACLNKKLKPLISAGILHLIFILKPLLWLPLLKCRQR